MTIDTLLFAIFPYIAIAIALVVTCLRYFNNRFTYSSLSSQFLESKQLFWGSVTWHYGILGILTIHILGFLMPRSLLAWNGVPWRLYILESTGLAMGFLSLWGIGVLIFRRLSQARIRVVTSPMDLVLLLALLVQVVAGVWTAIFYRWGSSWYATSAVPYLRSLFLFNPNLDVITTLPVMVKVHIVGAFALVLLLPFTRLVHFLSVPLQYIWRSPQVVVWNQRSIAPKT
ncbi:MAG TPA: respiratory nitrate reductase subunit gamma [Cyanobacteria bacterium UBA11149]|nr:respiratory nitrate reductase subunit gamma [Cyanobacteria bacterium UBA11367]HBE60287.1 respiratory nitrate reductase subunit gamma [Cyanobacteria bacterium UBA11366]HBK62550.1 respiratory nitrate reductase subunit gamma [Cyanobacteria bacterium UBA11166]HBR77065.1 respiratory nitrate reductase subunit gamma [Cyanobacteria bacterium UBA11159]HBS71416.1 respiratory nitrate reductase subunit gamma [Cyanobacteria bacterium UBA11153]HBW89399.1 respiratory nitrate reductase subunit gamma [Cyano